VSQVPSKESNAVYIGCSEAHSMHALFLMHFTFVFVFLLLKPWQHTEVKEKRSLGWARVGIRGSGGTLLP